MPGAALCGVSLFLIFHAKLPAFSLPPVAGSVLTSLCLFSTLLSLKCLLPDWGLRLEKRHFSLRTVSPWAGQQLLNFSTFSLREA